jgi:hypothetical protein
MSTISENELKAILKAIKEKPLEPNDEFYVPYFQPHHDPIMELYHHITRDDDHQSIALLSGFRGNGKSTEFRRLRALLEQQHYAVLLCDIEPFFNEHEPVAITDFLLSVALAANEAMKLKYGKNFTSESYLERFSDFLQKEIQFKDLNTGLALLSLVKEASFKKRLQNSMSTKIGTFVEEVNQFFASIRSFLVRQGHEQTVLLLDSFEKIRGIGENAHQIHESVDNLFRRYISDKLKLPEWHVVYTVPPYVTAIADVALGICTFLPNIRILKKDGSHDDQGIAIMKRVVERRFNWQQVFTESQMKRIILATAGSFRVFFRLMRIILLKAPADSKQLINVPIADELLERARNDLLREMIFLLPTEDKLWLQKIANSKTPEVSRESDKLTLMKFMDKDWVFLYYNGESWFDVNPLLKEKVID